MYKRYRVSISFRQEYRHVYEHLQGIPNNKSDYVAKAVEAYMHVKEPIVSYEEIKAIVMEILREQGNVTQSFIQQFIPHDTQISIEDSEMISQLF